MKGGAKTIWAGAGAIALAIAGAFTAITWPHEVATGAVAEVPGIVTAQPPLIPERDASGDDERQSIWDGMNQAMLAKDRDAFLSHTTGEATTQLATWWDGTSTIGWDVAAISPWDDYTVILGAQLAFAAHPERGSGADDAGLQLIQGFYYDVEWDGELISSITPYTEPMPWDEGPLYAARSGHVVLFGAADEQALVDANLAQAEASAQMALTEVHKLGGDVPMDGFVAAITDDSSRLSRWQFGAGQQWDMDVAGFAMPTYRPPSSAPWLDPRIATGDASSGTIVAVGPLSADQRSETFTHEFLHALHLTAAPTSESQPSVAVMEGFAEWATADSGAGEFSYLRPDVKDAVARSGTGAFSDDALRASDAWLGYGAAGSVYGFVQASGGDAWRLAVDAQRSGADLFTVAQAQNPALTPDAWQAWVAAQ